MSHIITSTLVYKNHLYVATLDGKIKVSSVVGLPSINDGEIIDLDSRIIIDIQAYKNKIYILTNEGLYCYKDKELELIKELYDATHIAIDKLKRKIFVLSGDRGLVCLSLTSKRFLGDIRFVSNVDISEEESITDIVANNGKIFISIMNNGVYRVDYLYKKKHFEMKSFLKIDLIAPQSLYFNESLNELSIVDYKLGLIVININSGEVKDNDCFHSIKPNNVISLKNGKKVVQTRKALYVINNNKSSIIIDHQVANVTSYYNNIYYSKSGVVHKIKI